MCLRPSDSSALELFRTKCKLLEHSLTGRLPVNLLISSSTCFASVITSPTPSSRRGLLPFIPSTADLYHSFISASHNLDCFLLLSLSRFTIVFQFGMAPLVSLSCSGGVQKNSRLIYLPPQFLYPIFLQRIISGTGI